MTTILARKKNGKKCQSVTGFKNVEGVLSKHLKGGSGILDCSVFKNGVPLPLLPGPLGGFNSGFLVYLSSNTNSFVVDPRRLEFLL